MQVEVRSKVPGATGPLLPTVLVELETEQVTVRELIQRAVLEQIVASRAARANAQAMLDRQYLLPGEVSSLAAAGAVKPPIVRGEPEPEVEVARAWRAFERGAFALFAGERRAESLAELLTLRFGEPVVFLRLTPLVGG